MLTSLINILESQDKISDWKIKETTQVGEEIFLIGSKIDMTRIKNVTHYMVTIYHDFKENGNDYKGSSSFLVHPTSTKKETIDLCKKAIFNAGFVKINGILL
jgi:hypothetical protein